jgi:hypothetical protein
LISGAGRRLAAFYLASFALAADSAPSLAGASD